MCFLVLHGHVPLWNEELDDLAGLPVMSRSAFVSPVIVRCRMPVPLRPLTLVRFSQGGTGSKSGQRPGVSCEVLTTRSVWSGKRPGAKALGAG